MNTLSRKALVSKWQSAYGAPPFKGARNTTLIRGLVYHVQSKRLGPLKPSLSRQMLKTAKPKNTVKKDEGILKAAKTKPKPKTKLGTQLVREWNGRTHTVHVTDKGYVMSGVTYSSLSAAAKAITGAHWSGPRFFGVAG
ncbi:DUF2924 domain-containing protein [Hellea sp.]|nr:DUF2924 domain-containing protein [Hellea sp.]